MVTKLRKNKAFYYFGMLLPAAFLSAVCTMCTECLIDIGEGPSTHSYSLHQAMGGVINDTEYWFFDIWVLLLLTVVALLMFGVLLMVSRAVQGKGFIERSLLGMFCTGALIYAFGYSLFYKEMPAVFYQLSAYHTWSLKKECILVGLCMLPLSYLFLLFFANILLLIRQKEWRNTSLVVQGIRLLLKGGLLRKIFIEILAAYGISTILILFLLQLIQCRKEVMVSVWGLLTLLFSAVCVWIFRTQGEVKTMLRISEGLFRLAKGEPVSENPARRNSALYETGAQLMEMDSNIKQAVKTARSSEQMKVDLITNISHDLKTPLSAIIGYGELLKQKELPLEAEELVDKINVKSGHLQEMLTDVMELSKVSSGVVQGKREKLNLVKLLEQSIGEYGDALLGSGVEFRRSYGEEEIYIESDGMLLHRVFQNLFDNAISYSLKGSRIYVQLRTEKNRVTVRIKNTASYEMKFQPERLTESFVRGDEARTGEGHGLGLAIASTYANACGGNFDIAVDGDQFQVILTFERYLKD